jgi:hypothetical protein
VKVTGIVGVLVIFVVVVAAIWHLVWLLKHSP